MSWSNRNWFTAANRSYGAPARRAAARSTSSTSVTLRVSSTSVPRCRISRATVSTHTKVAAWPRCVTSYGVTPHTYARSRPTTGSGRPAMDRRASTRSGCHIARGTWTAAHRGTTRRRTTDRARRRREDARMSSIEKSIEVDVPVSVAYNQWTQFEEFPQFMEGVEEVRQLDDKRLHWKATILGVTREWDAEIVDQKPDQQVAWRAVWRYQERRRGDV